jgi:hypothetical protein
MNNLKHYATSLEVTGSIPDKAIVLFLFNVANAPSRTIALGLTQPVTDMSTNSLPSGVGASAASAASA